MARTRTQTKTEEKRKVKITFDCDKDTLDRLKAISELANVSIDTTVCVILASYVVDLKDDAKKRTNVTRPNGEEWITKDVTLRKRTNRSNDVNFGLGDK